MINIDKIDNIVLTTRDDEEIHIPRECINNVDFEKIETSIYSNNDLSLKYSYVAGITTLHFKKLKKLREINSEYDDVIKRICNGSDIAVVSLFSKDNKELQIMPCWESDAEDKNKLQTYNLSKDKLVIWIEK